ncbi:SEC-C metal-binding domain-containing protein [Macrococcus equi]|uniref:SEC-C metal-binding domain-containing protein n=1 Tax=Macrococcus equi TaxID=3395462 RepID=UPI0039BE8B63
MRLATWKMNNLDNLNKFSKKQLNEYKNINYFNDSDYNIWCIAAETLEELITNSLFTAVRFPEELYIFETEDYYTIDKCQWYKDVSMKSAGDFLLDLSDYKIKDDAKIPKEYLVKEIPDHAVCFTVKPTNIKVTNELINKVFTRCQDEFLKRYRAPVYKDFYKSSELANTNRNQFIIYLLPLLWVYNIEFPNDEMYKINQMNWHVAEIISMTFISLYAENNYSILYKTLNNFRLWDSTQYGWKNDKYNEIWNECFRSLKSNVSKTYSAIVNKKISRNDLCPCKSGKKVKHCHANLL